jgi:predicted MPP superfamily phosphohydrolase
MKQKLHRIGILHLTDLHFLDNQKPKSRIGDIKDKTLGLALVRELTYDNCAKIFFDKIRSSIGDYNVDAIAYTGDLGWQNSNSSIESGADYLLKLAKKFNLKSDRIVICPGNHDIDRKAKSSAALTTFQRVCKKNGFIFAKWKEPACLKINGLPIIAFNSCLGATEHACHGVPKEIWKETQSYIRRFEKIMGSRGIDPNLKCMSQAMDIPAIGNSQRAFGLNYLRKEKKNCVIVLTHHNPLPTPNIEGRPYANLVDAGVLISDLMDNRRVFVLHGHTHCDSALCVKSPESSGSGLFVSLGSHGLHGLDGNASATYLQLLVNRLDRKSTRLNSSHVRTSRMPSSA